ncbi:MAG: hypothetical protein LBM62_03635 [Mediterranea sp.]|jgi:hypothetical protein|nr:hypothetical protein [Mediterranea sp.]
MKKALYATLLASLSVMMLQAMPKDTLYNDSKHDWVSGQYDTLPEWVFAAPQPDRVIAVSDPCLKPRAAYHQAILRAGYLYALQKGVSIQILSDLFQMMEQAARSKQDNIGRKLIALARIEQAVNNVSFSVENKHTSLFGECFLQVRFNEPADDDSTSFSFVSELMMVYTQEREEEKELKFQQNLRFTQKHEATLASYQLKGKPKDLLVSSHINSIPVDYQKKGCWYTDYRPDELKQIDISTPLQESFWSAYMASLTENLLVHPFLKGNIRVVNEDHNQEHQLTTRGINRERVVVQASVIPHIEGVKNNCLSVSWDIVEQ